MYKYIFNFVLFVSLIYLNITMGEDSDVVLGIAPALVLGVAQLGMAGVQKGNAMAAEADLEMKLNAAKQTLDDVEFVNKLEALTVPKNIRGMQAAERAETAAVETLKEAGQRGVANIPKAVQASTDAMVNITEEDRRAQFLADKAVQEQEQQIEVMNKQKDLQQAYQEIFGLQQAGKEARMQEQAANQAMLQAGVQEMATE